MHCNIISTIPLIFHCFCRLQKGINEFKQMHEVSVEREKKIVEQQTELKKYACFKLYNEIYVLLLQCMLVLILWL